jgi:hypothetical protein
MAGENLTPQQRAFLQKHLKLKLFSGKHDKKVTQAYERYLLVEQDYKTKMEALPGADLRVQALGGRAAPAMKLKNEGKFDEAAQALSPVIPDVVSLGNTLTLEHREALILYQQAIAPLPKDDPKTQTLMNQAAPSVTPAIKDMPAAIIALDQFVKLAGTRSIEIGQEFAPAKQGYVDALPGLPLTDTRVIGITGRAAPHLNAGTVDLKYKATVVFGGLKTECEQLKLTIGGEKTKLLQDLAKLTDPVGASQHEKAEMKRHRDAATAAMTDACPAPDAFATARKSMQALEKAIRSSSQISLLPVGTATKAREALQGFDTVLGDLEITPQVVADAKTARKQAEDNAYTASDNLTKANNLPNGTDQEKQQRTAAIQQAQLALTQANATLNTVTTRTKAILGKDMLGQALTVGPLSPDTGRPLSDGASQKFIEAFRTQPDTAQTALDLAQRSRDPDKLANALPSICAKVGNGFQSSNGTAFSSPGYARSYGDGLLKQGDFLGGDYFAGLDTFISTGKQFAPSLIGSSSGKKEREITSTRSQAVAGAMLGDDGKLDLSGAKLQTVMQQMKYSPEATLNGTPVLTQHMMHTLDQLKQGDNGPQAKLLIDGITAPTGKPGSDLVGVSCGKGKDQVVTEKETRQAVLKGFMTPMDQGPVGSCFTTAPTRRFREENPIGALKSMKEVATTGKFTSATGVKVPAVSNLPEGEDPILRSWEYSIATAAGNEAGSRERNMLANPMRTNPGMGKIADLIGGTNQLKKINAENSIQTEIRDAFHFSYNPTKPVKDANDGSSSTGCYQITETDEFGAPTGDPIDNPDKFIEVMTRRLQKKFNVDPTSDEGKKIAEHCKNDMLVTKTPNPPQQPYKALPNGSKPWDMSSGGLGLDPTKALFGDQVQTTQTLTPMPTNPKPTEGQRSKQVLMAVLTEAKKAATTPYQTIDSRGCHEYNALPMEESLQKLFGDTPEKMSENIDKLVEKGQNIASKELPVDRAQALFDKQTRKWLNGQNDPTAKQEIQAAIDLHRPTDKMLPAEVKRRTVECNKVAMDKLATQRGGTVKEIADRKDAFFKQIDEQALNELAIDLAPPQVVWADTNWGDGKSHIFFVMMPDPTSGELRMWKKVEPPGDLTPMKREDWIDKPMHITK